MTIANPLNKKAIVFNVGPKCGGPFAQDKGWQDFNIVQVIGGASVSKSWYDSLKGDRKSFFDDWVRKILKPCFFASNLSLDSLRIFADGNAKLKLPIKNKMAIKAIR